MRWIALECADCIGRRRMRWNAPTALECAGKHRLRRLRRIALEFCLQPLTAGSSSRSPAISLRLSVREIKNSGQKLNVLLF